MTEPLPRCDFYDWATARRCDQPANWVTHQSTVGTGRVRHYCDAHRPPRAHPIGEPSPTRRDRASKPEP